MERPQPTRRNARARQAPVLRLFPRERQHSGAQARYTCKAAHEVNTAADMWEHGIAPKKGAPSLVQYSSIGHGATTAGAAQRASVAIARIAPPPQRDAAQWRRSALHAQAGSRSGRSGWHVEARPSTGKWRPLARAVLSGRVWSDLSQCGATLARGKRTCCASSPETASAVAHKRATRASRLTKWTLLLLRGSVALHRRRAASRWLWSLRTLWKGTAQVKVRPSSVPGARLPNSEPQRSLISKTAFFLP